MPTDIVIISINLIKELGCSRLRQSDIHPISPKTTIENKIKIQSIDRKMDRDRAALANEKTLALLLKPASPTLSNTGSG